MNDKVDIITLLDGTVVKIRPGRLMILVYQEQVDALERRLGQPVKQIALDDPKNVVWRYQQSRDDRLYGQDGDERLYLDLESAIDEAVDRQVDRVTFPFDVCVEEFSVLPKGEFANCRIMTGAEMAEHLAEYGTEDVGFEEIWEDYMEAAKRPEVIAAFEAARDVLVATQRFLVADRVVARWRCTVTAGDTPGGVQWTEPEREEL